MAKTAAVFDLDRTLIRSSSAPLFQRHLTEAGIDDTPSVPLADLYLKYYETFGESWVLMQPAKLGVKAAKDWPVDVVAEAMEHAAEELEELLLPFAPIVFANHREAGDLLVMATTSPEPFVRPFAERLGFDAVVATRWEAEDGVYTGQLDSPFYWGRKKLEGVEEWAADNDVDLSRSHAYSDSYFDTPLLSAVGNPVAVNPDSRLAGVAALQRWEIRNLDKPTGMLTFLGRELQEWARPLVRPELVRFADFEFDGVENIPADGAAIIVFNHRSYFDVTTMALLSAQSGRSFRSLGKRELFDMPLIGKLAQQLGGIEVDRGSGSGEPLEKGMEILRAGQVLALAPEGTIPRGPAFFEPELKGRTGAARLAAATGAPVIPVGLWGTEKVWPRSSRGPKLPGLNRPVVSASVGKPVKLTAKTHPTNTKKIMKAISAQLPAVARKPHTPTEEELALTYPRGKAPSDTAPSTAAPSEDA